MTGSGTLAEPLAAALRVRVADELELIAESLWQRAPQLAERQVALARTLRSYDHVPVEDLMRSARRNTLRVVATLKGSTQLPMEAEEDERASSMQRSLQGIDAEDIVLCYRLVMGCLRDEFIETATALGVGADVTLAGTRELWAITDRYSNDLVTVRSRIDLGVARRQDRQRQVFLQRLLLGGLRPSEIAISGALYGIAPDRQFWVFRASQLSDRPAPDLITHLERFATGSPSAPLVGVSDGDLVGLASRRPTPFDSETPIALVGPTRVPGISHAFAESSRLLDVAKRFGKGGLIETDTLGVLMAVANEPEVGESLHEKYVGRVLAAGGVMPDILLETVNSFLEHNRAYQNTADDLNVQVNTLRHRLARYEELVGDSFARTETAFEAWWALRYARIRAGSAG
jgi:hypothetical protein